jgi:pimeloyl-ACP methyl ester carboxylesterase
MPPEFVEGMRGSEMWPGLEAVAPTIAYDGRQVGDAMSGEPLRSERWGGVEIPVLVMYGEGTWPFLATGSQAVAAVLPTATVKAVPGENHSTTAEVLAPELRAFASDDTASDHTEEA